MKKLALSLFKSADEKLRSLTYKGHNSSKSNTNTYCGAQNGEADDSKNAVTPTRSEAPDVPPPPIPYASTFNSLQSLSHDLQSNSDLTNQSRSSLIVDEAELDVPPPIYPKSRIAIMAERRLQRNNKKGGLTEENVLKKRSRSEGPHGRRKMRNSMHETTKTNQVKPATNGRHSMYTGHVSDDNDVAMHSGSDQSPDSDMAEQQWTKSPQMIRKSRKTDRTSKTDKRRSAHNVEKRESVEQRGPSLYQTTQNRDLFIFPKKTDSQFSGGQKSKFQRMEENRNKRIDMTVTSDEECSPQLRISRLRQRAMMSSNIGNNASFEGGMNIVPTRNDGSVNASQEFINGTDRSRLSQYDECRLSKYDDNFHIDQVNGVHSKSQSGKHPKLPNVLPEFLPENRHSVNVKHLSGNHGDFDHVTKRIANQIQSVPVKQIITKHEPEVSNRQRHSHGRVKLSSESPKLRNFTEVKTSQPTQLKKADQKIELVPRSPNSSSDSLDDLIESNIQYLESEIESGKIKRQSGNYSNYSPEKVLQTQVLRQPLRPQTQSSHVNDDVRSKIYDPRTYVSNKLMSTVTKIEPKVQKPTVYSSQPVSNYSNSVTQSRSEYSNTVSQSRSEHRNIPSSGSATYSPYMQRRQYETNHDISKSDSHLNECNTQFTPSQHSFQAPKSYAPYPVLNKQTGNVIYVQPDANIEEQIQLSENGYVPAVDSGMFSDVEYNIEVSERIKKWEKKLTPSELEERRKVLNTIKEYESFSDSNSKDTLPDTPVEVRRELWQLVSPTDNSGVGRLSVNLTKSTASVSDSNVQDQSGSYFEPKVVSSETNLHRVFRVVSEPPTKGTRSNDRTIYPDRQVEKVSTSSRRKVASENSGHTQSMSNVTLSESEIGSMQQSWPPMVVDSDSGIRKSWRMSRYEDEISELKELVSDNFNDIRKRFDSDMSETDTKRASSPVSRVPPTGQPSTTSGTAKLTLNIQPVTPNIQRSPVSIRRKLSDQSPPASPIVMVTPKPERKVPVYRNVPIETKSAMTGPPTAPKQTTVTELKPQMKLAPKNAPELWSPNMESRQGLVSIERVKARTLQTIPFSEDPVWKDLEGLATFEKPEGNETAKHVNFDEIDELLKLATGGMDNLNHKPSSNFEQQMNRLTNSDNFLAPNSQSKNVMSQSYSTSMSQLHAPKEKQRALSDSSFPTSQSQTMPLNKHTFTPPTIQPLKLNSQPNKKSSTSALDEVLEDIRASLQKKPLSPKLMKNLDTSEENSSTNLSLQSPLTKSSKSFVFPREPKRDIKEPVTNSTEVVKSSTATPGYDNTQSSWKPAPAEIPSQLANVPYIDPEFTQFPYIINGNYHLDPKLLSEKLKSTGLANDSSDDHVVKQKKAFTEQALNNILSGNVGNQISQERSRSQSKPNIHELDQSVDDLRSLAQEVEFKLGQIKSRIVSADEERLDSILLALRKFAPITEQTYFNVKFTPNYDSVKKARRNKLQDALGELDKMYESLDLDDKSLMDRASRREETIGFESERLGKSTAKSSSSASIQLSANTDRKPISGASSNDTRILRKSQIDEIERQTQNEFEDITKSFQVLLDEVTKQCRSVARGSSKYSSTDPNVRLPSLSAPQYSSQRPPDEIRQVPPRHQLKLDTSQRAVQDSYNTAIKELESVAMGAMEQHEVKPVQSVMYLNLDKSKSANQNNNQFQASNNLVSPTRNLDIQLQSKTSTTDNKKVKSSVPQSASSSQFVSMATEFNKPLVAASIIRDTSSSDNQDELQKNSASLKIELNNAKQPSKNGGRFRKRGNIEHRKSMPAITRTVETQTVETQTEPSSSVSEMKEKFEQFRKASLQDMLSDSSPDLKYDRRLLRKLSSGRVMDVSSSEDEHGRGSKIRHSLSAPDIVALLMDFDKKEKMEPKADKVTKTAAKTPKSVKQRHDKARFRSLKDESSVRPIDMAATMTADDGVETPKSKPPVYPIWKYPGQVESPPVKKAESKKSPFAVDRDFTTTASDTEQDRSEQSGNISTVDGDSVVRRRTRSFGGEGEATEERPRSFHELVATFEQDPKRLEKIRLSGLRKCASEDSMFTDLVLQKIFHSESDLNSARKMSGSGSKLALELKIKS